jgi:hypothetical protein
VHHAFHKACNRDTVSRIPWNDERIVNVFKSQRCPAERILHLFSRLVHRTAPKGVHRRGLHVCDSVSPSTTMKKLLLLLTIAALAGGLILLKQQQQCAAAEDYQEDLFV